MWDLATSPTSQKIIVEFHEANKILAAVCHGPVAFSHVKLPDGSYLLDGHKVAGFSNSEEAVMGYTNAVPFSLEDQLNKASGGGYVKAEQDWGEKVITEKGKGGGWLITGQNPASAKGVGEAILAKL
jgi:putative intracellular protease/amidase